MKFLVFTIFFLHVSFLIGNVNINIEDLKQCFERYIGRKLVGLSPYHTEFKMAEEEECLKFCYKTASRCRSIVHDRVRHICYFFNDGDQDMTTFAKKMSYFKVTDPRCFQYLNEGIENTRLAGPIYTPPKEEARDPIYIVSSTEIPKTTTIKIEIPTTTTEKVTTTNEIKSKEDVKAIYKEILQHPAEGVLSLENNNEFDIDTTTKEIDLIKSFEDVSGKLMPKVSGFKAIKRPINENSILSDEEDKPEIRRKQQNIKTTNKLSEINEIELLDKTFPLNDSQYKLIQPEEKNFTGYNDCESGDVRIWMAIENSEFLPLPDDDRFIIIDADNEMGCKKKCEKSNCDIFTLDEKDKNCRLHYAKNEENGNYFINQIVHSSTDDFSSRTFKQLCYPSQYVGLSQCTDIISFLEYTVYTDPKEVYSGFPSGSDGILNCVELCYLSKNFICKSATFDLESGECKLFENDSITSPELFKSLPKSKLIYFENGCNIEEFDLKNARINKVNRS
ncbi:PAN-1 domain and Apple-like domain-containing protein [Strongyloides ratti]|uniref:PAN-1 domain and Apple-like domain-containing protein n=1 Tax=Strongyloides ratti TaxID=34506 RepID=A0A090LH59_STRRB|nr:PAN-1 domain and Apple-like domain-containing protein [Strongyloides ratti]CEF69131.1 PAN-1 domain and Apple-like domain-containing protein [Strongyloides ratti]